MIWLLWCRFYSLFGRFLWGNKRTRQISVRRRDGTIRLFKVP